MPTNVVVTAGRVSDPIRSDLTFSDPKAQRAYVKLLKTQAGRQDLDRALQFLKDNPWIQVFGALLINDFLRYSGIISKSKSSDIGLIIAGLGVAVNGGGTAASAIAGLVGGTFEFFPDNPRAPLPNMPGTNLPPGSMPIPIGPPTTGPIQV